MAFFRRKEGRSGEADLSVFDSTLSADGFDVEMRELVAGTRVDFRRGVIDVVVHHPLFPLLGQEHRLEVALAGLRAALGDDGVERWLGDIDVAADAPIDAIPVASLGVVVDQLRPAR